MYAVIKSGGKQYRVAPGDRVRLERLEVEEGEPVVFNEVLLVKNGADVQVGAPLVENASVKATVEAHGRGRKIIVYKFKRRKGFHKKQGHRQDYTMVRIEEVLTGARAASESEEPESAEASGEE